MTRATSIKANALDDAIMQLERNSTPPRLLNVAKEFRHSLIMEEAKSLTSLSKRSATVLVNPQKPSSRLRGYGSVRSQIRTSTTSGPGGNKVRSILRRKSKSSKIDTKIIKKTKVSRKELEKQIAELEAAVEELSNSDFKTPIYHCLGDFRKCKIRGNLVVCAGLLLICIAQLSIPFTASVVQITGGKEE